MQALIPGKSRQCEGSCQVAREEGNRIVRGKVTRKRHHEEKADVADLVGGNGEISELFLRFPSRTLDSIPC